MKTSTKQEGRFNRATFIVDPLILAKMKIIAAFDQVTYNYAIERALASYMRTWQVAHPFIDLDKATLKLNQE